MTTPDKPAGRRRRLRLRLSWRRMLVVVAAAICALAGAVALSGPARSAPAVAGSAGADAGPAPAAAAAGAGRAAAAIVPAGHSTLFDVVPASDPARQATLMKTRCNQPVAGVTCVFAPTGAPAPVLGQYQLLSSRPYYVCEPSGSVTVSETTTTDMSDTVGVSVSVELGAVVRQAIEASFGVTWSQSYSTTVEDRMNLGAYTAGFAYRAAPLLRAAGNLIIREKGASGLGDTGANTYELTGVVFDAPDTAATANGVVAFASRPMTAAEKTTHCTAQARG